MSFQTELRQQAQSLGDRLRDGETVRLPSTTGGDLLLEEAAIAFEKAVVVSVPTDLDQTAYVLLSAAGQCGAAALEAVAGELAACPADPSGALDELGRALEQRPLFVGAVDTLGAGAPFELPAVFAGQARRARTWLEERLVCGTYRAPSDVDEQPVRALLARVPTIGNDPIAEHLRVTLARTVLGAELPDDGADLGQQLHRAVPIEVRHVLDVLTVHGRPIARALLVEAELVSSEELASAVSSGFVQERWDQVRLAPAVAWVHRMPSTLRRDRQRTMADAFARVSMEQGPFASTATLEAHRHYSELGDLSRARQFARYGVQLLLAAGRRASLNGSYSKAIRAYATVLELDEQSRSNGDSTGVGAEARAYAIHYRAYNRYKSEPDIPPAETLNAYREALTHWPINALFWSRTIICCYVAELYADGYRALDDALHVVPDHAARADYLIRRTTDRLIGRDLLVPAWLVWRDHRPASLSERHVLSRLADLSELGTPVRRLWGPGGVELPLRRPLTLKVIRENGTHEVSMAGATEKVPRADVGLGQLTRALRDSARAWLETPEPEAGAAGAEISTALDRAVLALGDEDARWLGYLQLLQELAENDEGVGRQRAALLRAWARIREHVPSVRYPLGGRSAEGVVHWTWKYHDIEGVTLTIEALPDERMHWFFRDASTGTAVGSEEPLRELPDVALEHAAAFVR